MERITDTDSVNVLEAMLEPLLDAQEAAKHLGVHPKTLQRMARAGKVPCFRIGRYVKFRLSALDVWVRGSENRVSQPFA
jgi:excisionase family DNA binding protein